MTLPEGVRLARRGRLQFVTQRGYWTPPFTSCMFASLATLLIYGGYRLPLATKEENTPPENFVLSLHKASGAPLDEGSNVRQSQVALQELLPDAVVVFGRASADDLFTRMKGNKVAVRVAVDCEKLPFALKKWVGRGYNGNHAVTLSKVQWYAGKRIAYWIDPMGKSWEGYIGEWVDWDEVSPSFLAGKDGLANYTLVQKSSSSKAARLDPAV